MANPLPRRPSFAPSESKCFTPFHYHRSTELRILKYAGQNKLDRPNSSTTFTGRIGPQPFLLSDLRSPPLSHAIYNMLHSFSPYFAGRRGTIAFTLNSKTLGIKLFIVPRNFMNMLVRAHFPHVVPSRLHTLSRFGTNDNLQFPIGTPAKFHKKLSKICLQFPSTFTFDPPQQRAQAWTSELGAIRPRVKLATRVPCAHTLVKSHAPPGERRRSLSFLRLVSSSRFVLRTARGRLPPGRYIRPRVDRCPPSTPVPSTTRSRTAISLQSSTSTPRMS
jgi:hypothetical protein